MSSADEKATVQQEVGENPPITDVDKGNAGPPKGLSRAKKGRVVVWADGWYVDHD